MAVRPVFMPTPGTPAVEVLDVAFQWHPGLAVAQKRKSIGSLHAAARAVGVDPILEISSKSEDSLGRALSAFSLVVDLPELSRPISVESAFQGSKIFAQGGPYQDLYCATPLAAKGDLRLRSSGDLTAFRLGVTDWPTEPKTAFYDWIYLTALKQRSDLAQLLCRYAGFTDIEFNPAKSFSCQARSAAIFVGLERSGTLGSVTADSATFLNWYGADADGSKGPGQQLSLI